MDKCKPKWGDELMCLALLTVGRPLSTDTPLAFPSMSIDEIGGWFRYRKRAEDFALLHTDLSPAAFREAYYEWWCMKEKQNEDDST